MVNPVRRKISTSGYWHSAQDLHVICIGDLSVLVTNDGELEVGSSNIINVLDPVCMGLDGVRG